MRTLEEVKTAVSNYELDSFCYVSSEIPQNKLAIRWLVGGASGGNCWGGRAKRIRPESEPMDELNAKALNAFEYITSSMFATDEEKEEYLTEIYCAMTEGDYTDNEYYGNYYNYNYRYISLEDVYEIAYKFSRVARIDLILKELE